MQVFSTLIVAALLARFKMLRRNASERPLTAGHQGGSFALESVGRPHLEYARRKFGKKSTSPKQAVIKDSRQEIV